MIIVVCDVQYVVYGYLGDGDGNCYAIYLGLCKNVKFNEIKSKKVDLPVSCEQSFFEREKTIHNLGG